MGQLFFNSMFESARKRYLESMMAGIMEMGMEGENFDVEIIVEGESFFCYKFLLVVGNNFYFYFEYKQVFVTILKSIY